MLCDDDATLRAVLRELVDSAGHTVVAEVDTSVDADTCLERVAVDAMIVDLSLRFGSGRDVLESAVRRGCPAIVFTAFGEMAEAAELPGRPAVVAKPDFWALEQQLARLGEDAGDEEDRRRSAQRSDPMRLPSSADEPHVFYDVLNRAIPGDVVMAVEATDLPADLDVLCETARTVVRAQDRLMRTPKGVIVLLMAGAPDVGERVEGRIAAAWADPGQVRAPTVRWTHIADGEQPVDAFARVRRPSQVATTAD